MQDFDASTRYYIFANREGRGWKLAHGNLFSYDDAVAARAEIAQQEDVLETRTTQVTTELVY